MKYTPKAVVLHVGTNDLKQNSAEGVVQKIRGVINICKEKIPTTKIVISNIVSRDDKQTYQTMLEYVNACINMTYAKDEKILIARNTNIVKKHRAHDGTHLNTVGTSILANNLKYCVAKALNIEVIKKQYRPSRYQSK